MFAINSLYNILLSIRAQFNSCFISFTTMKFLHSTHFISWFFINQKTIIHDQILLHEKTQIWQAFRLSSCLNGSSKNIHHLCSASSLLQVSLSLLNPDSLLTLCAWTSQTYCSCCSFCWIFPHVLCPLRYPYSNPRSGKNNLTVLKFCYSLFS